ncbi:hypothetical protein [Alphabaculovirus myunipunctae]|uniref:Uncharacterized protein n=1 Tax=Mythimna unipuncta nucleopolyhedrovirus TaxID=447897 RepID=A0A2K9VSI2_9ABAC|nr:hypothetical protein [Mythimna unipuncta nucleopolyhedrovirus]AUV65392.1 hypothetical protein [Mythimna unipuncta nucleopolyhedrovirus]
MIFLDSKVCPLMQYKCEYVSTLKIYNKFSIFTPPDITDLDVNETKQFLMYVPEKLSTWTSPTATFSPLVVGDERRSWFFNTDVYRCDSVSFGGRTIGNLGRMCLKNERLCLLMQSVVAYEIHARLETLNSFEIDDAFEWVACVKVYAQIMCGLLCIDANGKHRRDRDDEDKKQLYTLCRQVLAPNFNPNVESDTFRFLLETAKNIGREMFTDCVVLKDNIMPIDIVNFKVNNKTSDGDDDDNVDVYSLYLYTWQFLKCICDSIDVPYDSQCDSQIVFNVTFSDGNKRQSSIFNHTIKNMDSLLSFYYTNSTKR